MGFNPSRPLHFWTEKAMCHPRDNATRVFWTFSFHPLPPENATLKSLNISSPKKIWVRVGQGIRGARALHLMHFPREDGGMKKSKIPL